MRTSGGVLVLWARHGENEANLTRRFSHRRLDLDLTARGRAQAQRLAAGFGLQAERGPRVTGSVQLSVAPSAADRRDRGRPTRRGGIPGGCSHLGFGSEVGSRHGCGRYGPGRASSKSTVITALPPAIRSRVVGARPAKKCLAVLFSGRISARNRLMPASRALAIRGYMSSRATPWCCHSSATRIATSPVVGSVSSGRSAPHRQSHGHRLRSPPRVALPRCRVTGRVSCPVSMVTPPWNREIALSAEIRFGSSARAARSSPDSGRIRRASDEEFDM
jgi:hypothetical protein